MFWIWPCDRSPASAADASRSRPASPYTSARLPRVFCVAEPSRDELAQDPDPLVGPARQPERQPEVAQDDEVGRIALQRLPIHGLRLGMAAQAVERDAARGQDRHVVRPLGLRDVEVLQRLAGPAGADLGPGQLEQHVRILRAAAVRLVQRLLGAGELPHAGIAAAEAHESIDRLRVGVVRLVIERRRGLEVPGVRRPVSQARRRAAPAVRHP